MVLTLSSREILTGLSVIRAFGTQKHEEERFDDANKKLTRYKPFTKPYYDVYDAANDVYNVQCYHADRMGRRSQKIDAGTLQVGAMTAFIPYAMQIVMAFLMMTVMSIMVPRAGVCSKPY